MLDIKDIDFNKLGSGLVPCCVVDYQTNELLMVGFMNEMAVVKTQELKKVTFFSRTKNRLWTKGETSNNFLELIDMSLDCDNDTIIAYAKPCGPVCHTGNRTCFYKSNYLSSIDVINELSRVISERNKHRDEASYTVSLLKHGTKRCAQKVGEEGVEVALAAATNDNGELIKESADLIFHLLVLLELKGLSIYDVCEILKERRNGIGLHK
jgi:phosphoribosyl-ATP pyrophosphohydrolase/phosphoribosyl-AMP cyclohydrolase